MLIFKMHSVNGKLLRFEFCFICIEQLYLKWNTKEWDPLSSSFLFRHHVAICVFINSVKSLVSCTFYKSRFSHVLDHEFDYCSVFFYKAVILVSFKILIAFTNCLVRSKAPECYLHIIWLLQISFWKQLWRSINIACQNGKQIPLTL